MFHFLTVSATVSSIWYPESSFSMFRHAWSVEINDIPTLELMLVVPSGNVNKNPKDPSWIEDETVDQLNLWEPLKALIELGAVSKSQCRQRTIDEILGPPRPCGCREMV